MVYLWPMEYEASPATVTARLCVAYDGRDFHGWQIQPRHRTVQGVIVDALRRLVPLDGIPPGAGRTDTGVHARGQVCTVPLSDPAHFERIHDALPRMMPEDVLIHAVDRVAPDFHARFSARGRRYRYRIGIEPNPFHRHDRWTPGGTLDRDRMAEALAALLGRHDCTSFCVASSLEEGRTECEIRDASIEFEPGGLVFRIAADRFLHSMVRTIVGTLVEIGRGRREPDALGVALAARDRSAAGPTAPPQGLCLDSVDYDGWNSGATAP